MLDVDWLFGVNEMAKTKYAPGIAVDLIKHQTGITGHRGRYRYWDSFDWFCWYCVIPPVYPTFSRGPHHPVLRHPFSSGIQEPCIVCGKIHNTSEDCGREPRERRMRDATVRRDDGYKLIQAKNMGMFDDI